MENALQVYPTLVNDFVQINLSTETNLTTANLKVINELGQTLLQHKIESNQEQIDLSQLNAGIYFISVQTENGRAVSRVVKG